MIYKLIKNREFIGGSYFDLIMQEGHKEEVIFICRKMFIEGYVFNALKYGYEIPNYKEIPYSSDGRVNE